MNPYTHLRTLIDDESRHQELCVKLQGIITNQELVSYEEYEENYKAVWKFDDKRTVSDNYPKCVRMHMEYTTSLDALIPLWPVGWAWMVGKIRTGNYHCSATMNGNFFVSDMIHPALAMLDALLQVKEYEHD